MSTLALLQDMSAASARAAKAEEERRAALSPRQRAAEDFRRKFRHRLAWTLLFAIPLTTIVLAAVGAISVFLWVIARLH